MIVFLTLGGELLAQTPAPWQAFRCLSPLSADQKFVTGGQAGQLVCRDGRTGEVVVRGEEPSPPMGSAAIGGLLWAPDQLHLLVWQQGQSRPQLWNSQTGLGQGLPTLPGRIRCLASSARQWVAFTDSSQLIATLWGDPAMSQVISLPSGRGNQVRTADFSPDQEWLCSGGTGGDVSVFRARDWRLVQSWQAASDWIRSVVWVAKGVVLISDDQKLQLWSAQGQSMGSIDLAAQPTCLAVQPSGVWSVGTDQGELLIGTLDHPHIAKRWKAHEAPITGLAWTSDGQNLISASLDSTLKLWQSADGQLLGQISP